MDREDLIEKMRLIRDKREKEIFETNQKANKNISVEKVEYIGKMEFMEDVDGKKKMVEKDVFMLTEKSDDKQLLKTYDEDMNLLWVEIPETGQVLSPENSKEINQLMLQKTREMRKDGKSLEDLEKEDEKDEENKKKEISYDITKGKQDLQITFYRKIIDKTFMQEFPETCQGAKEIGMAYSETLGSYILVAKYQDGFEIAKGTQPAKKTMRQVYNVDRQEGSIEKESPHALMPINGNGNKNGTKELSITIGQYGYIETQVVSVSRENERIGEDIAEQGESRIKQEKTYKEKQQEKEWGTEKTEIKADLIEDEPNPEVYSIKQSIIDNILEQYGEELNSLYNGNEEEIRLSIERRIEKAVKNGKITENDIQKAVENDIKEDIDVDQDTGNMMRR